LNPLSSAAQASLHSISRAAKRRLRLKRVRVDNAPATGFVANVSPKNPFGSPLALTTLEGRVAAQEPEFALLRECIEWPQIPAWIEFEKRWRNRNDLAC
jgi:hypothetical protein